VAVWISERLKHSQQRPQPQHAQADPAAQEAFKKREGAAA
jgi:hypothetical protein